MIKTELRDLFLNHFAQGIKPQNHFKIGIEHEKFLFNEKNHLFFNNLPLSFFALWC